MIEIEDLQSFLRESVVTEHTPSLARPPFSCPCVWVGWGTPQHSLGVEAGMW